MVRAVTARALEQINAAQLAPIFVEEPDTDTIDFERFGRDFGDDPGRLLEIALGQGFVRGELHDGHLLPLHALEAGCLLFGDLFQIGNVGEDDDAGHDFALGVARGGCIGEHVAFLAVLPPDDDLHVLLGLTVQDRLREGEFLGFERSPVGMERLPVLGVAPHGNVREHLPGIAANIQGGGIRETNPDIGRVGHEDTRRGMLDGGVEEGLRRGGFILRAGPFGHLEAEALIHLLELGRAARHATLQFFVVPAQLFLNAQVADGKSVEDGDALYRLQVPVCILSFAVGERDLAEHLVAHDGGDGKKRPQRDMPGRNALVLVVCVADVRVEPLVRIQRVAPEARVEAVASPGKPELSFRCGDLALVHQLGEGVDHVVAVVRVYGRDETVFAAGEDPDRRNGRHEIPFPDCSPYGFPGGLWVRGQAPLCGSDTPGDRSPRRDANRPVLLAEEP